MQCLLRSLVVKTQQGADRIMETQIYRQTVGGSHSNIYIMPIDAPFPEGARQDLDIQTHIHSYTRAHKMAITQARLCLSLLEVEKRRV